MKPFDSLPLSDAVMDAINELGFEEMTPIQDQTMTMALAGRDVIGQAPTGTGKTVAFGVPLVERATRERTGTQAMVVTPTRELAVQVAVELNKLGQTKGIDALPIYGGQDIGRQIRALKRNPPIIVGTPGRVLDHIRRRTIRLDTVSMAVLDEADEMLNMGFLEDIESILEQMPTKRQTLLFSATIPKPIENLARKFMHNPELVRVAAKELTVPNTDQYYVEVHESKKFDILCNLLDMHGPSAAIVFGRTKRRADELAEALAKRGYSAEAIHGDLPQPRRDAVMGQFKAGTVEILVATDVAARGLDITGVTHVYNFDIPQDPESYVHRIGRTGRAGRSGEAYTFCTPREISQLRVIEQLTKRPMKRRSAPSLADASQGLQQVALEQLVSAAADPSIDKFRSLAESLLEDHDSVSLTAAALKLLTREPNTTPVRLTEERPVIAKKPARGRYPGPRRQGKPSWHHKGKPQGRRRS